MNLSPSKLGSGLFGILSEVPSFETLVFGDGSLKTLSGESTASFS